MKKNAIHFLMLAVALTLLSLPVVAQTGSTGATGGGQGRHHGMPSVDEQLQHLTKRLNLTADQQAKIKPILEDQHTQIASLKQDTSMSRPDRRAKFEQIREDSHQKIRDVLNDDQRAKFDQMQAWRKEHMSKRGSQSDTGTSKQ